MVVRLCRKPLLLSVAVLLISCLPAHGADLKEAVEQLAASLGGSVPEGRVLRIAVTDFPDLQGVNSDLSRYIAERLTTRLSGQPQKFRVIERRRLGLVLGELKFSMSDLVDPTKAKQLGKMLGVEGLVVGSVADLGNQVDVDCRIIEIESNNLFPGVTATVSKDQVVTQLLAQGREAVVSVSPSIAGGPATSATSASSSVGQRSGVHPIETVFSEMGGQLKARVFNVEIVERRFLRINLALELRTSFPMGVKLDSPQDTVFLVDQLGRQHQLVQAVGITADQVARVSPGSSRRFSLLFGLAPDLESFKYEAVVVAIYDARRSRIGGTDRDEIRLRIRGDRAINLSDFR